MTALITRLYAALIAATVVLGLVTAPPEAPGAATLAAVNIADIQLEAATAATPQAAGKIQPTADAQPNVQLPSLQGVVDVVKSVVTAAAWYVSFPVTLPYLLALSAAGAVFTAYFSGFQHGLDIGAALVEGLRLFITVPLDLIKQSVTNLFQPATPVAAQAQSGSVAEPKARQSATPAQRSVASSRRAALAAVRAQPAPAADLTAPVSASTHRTADASDTDTANTPAKQTATGSSGRGVKKSQAD
ncbi:hypothetical protein [Mycobacterium sp. M26]|uniref:hypothetical protein n=1 Tax=Mycobacterium sp. M26 TaxID=1762962 RepID=UPI00073EE206|nr:hypothetical protein [Mycobacterium sp. M26]